MPELPEVQTVADHIKPEILGNYILSVDPIWNKVLDNFDSKDIEGRHKILNVTRRAKFIIIQFENFLLAIHLRMTGKLYVLENDSHPKHTSAIFFLEGGKKLIFEDTRKFGRIYRYNDLTEINERHGPEPLESNFTSESLVRLIKSKKRNIKALLLDQSMIAGLGNIYADESLWKSKIHPNSLSHKIPKKRIEDLYNNIKIILTEAIEQNGTTIIDFSVNGESGKYTNELKIYGKVNSNCYRCKYKIMKIRVAGRGTYICKKCQKKYK